MTIPDTIIGLPVTAIGTEAFGTAYTLTGVTIPATVTSIGNYAFYNCMQLTSVYFSGTAPAMGTGVFENGPSSLTMYYFNNAPGFTFPTWYGYQAIDFSYTTTNGIATINGCSATAGAVTIPSAINGLAVTTITSNAFASSTNMATVSIPGTVTSIGASAFANCGNLTAITVSAQNPDYSSTNGVLFNENQTTLIECPRALGGSYTVPGTVTTIGTSAFAGCAGVMSVTIPAGVTTISSQAFDGCTALNSAYFMGAAPKMETGAFNSVGAGFAIYSFNNAQGFTVPLWHGLESVNLDDTTSAGQVTITAYTGSNGILYIPGTINGLPVTSIASNVFDGCANLTGVTIPSNVTSIGSNAFDGCANLTTATISGSVTSIGNDAFYDCPSLTGVYFLGNAPTIGASVFSGESTATVYYLAGTTGWGSTFGGITATQLPFNYTTSSSQITITQYIGSGGAVAIPGAINGLPVTGLGASTFDSCQSLTSVTIPSSVNSIGNDAFYSCTSLTSVTIPNGVTTISTGVFVYCTKLRSVTMPGSVTSIGDYAFYECGALPSVTIPRSVTSIGNYTFEGCTGLTTLAIPEGVASIGDYSFAGCTGLTGIAMPGGLTSIGQNAFSGCTGLTAVTIPQTVTSLGSQAFDGCTGLSTLVISSSSVGYEAFYNCTGLSNVTLSNGVASIGGFAFAGSSITSLTIPASLTSIADWAFDSCADLTSITVSAQNPAYSSGGGVLFDKGQSTVLQYPGGLAGNYTIPGGVTVIGDNAFQGCAGLTAVTIPNTVTTIGSQAFLGCTSLATVMIPDSVNGIGDFAFYGCSSLSSIIFAGNAPAMATRIFSFDPSNFTIYYYNGATGFTSPTWYEGYPAVDLGYSPVATWLLSKGFAYNADLQSAPNGDGVPLLMDYALNLDPTRNQSAGIPSPAISGTHISLTFYAGRAGITYLVQTSADLQNWTTTGVTVSAPDANGLCTATAPVTSTSAFMRLMVAY